MILTNTTDGVKAFTLSHDVYCAALGACACVPCLPFGRMRPGVLTLAEGQQRVVTRAVLSVPEIEAAVRRGRVRIEGDG
jgi:hypothetical protein